MEITRLNLYEVYNSRAEPTVQAQVNQVCAAAPSGASTGSREVSNHIPNNLDTVAGELRDRLVNTTTSTEVDQVLREVDGTDRFERLGCVSTAVSMAAWKLRNQGEVENGQVFPYPLGNVVGGGVHGGSTPIQEFLILPTQADTFPAAVETNAQVYRGLRERYATKVRGVNDESAYILDADTYKTLDLLNTLAEEYGARIGLDVAANTFYEDGIYHYPGLDLALSTEEHVDFLLSLIDEYNLVYVEDPFHEDDVQGFVKLREHVTREELDCFIVGDDLTTTHAERIGNMAGQDAITGSILKPNQVGTVSDTRTALETCREHNVLPVISHRSGETTDATIADLAVAWNVPVIKAGIAGIRVAKLNRLLSLWNAADRPTLADMP